MKLFIRHIIILFIVLFVSYFICLIIYTNGILKNKSSNVKNLTSEGFCLQRFRDIEKYKNIDFLFLGPSHTYRGFDTRIFSENNITSFNMGSSNQSPVNTYYLLKTYINKIHPKTIIFEISSETLEIDGNESSIDLISNLPFSWDLIKMGFSSKNNLITVNSIFSIFLNRICHSFKNEMQKAVKDNKYIEGGFVEFTGNSTYSNIINNPVINPHKSNIENYQLKYLKMIIELIKSNKINLILVSTPITAEYKHSIINYNEIKSKIMSIASEENVKYIDFNDAEYFNKMNLKTDKHFFDYTHLNKEGTGIFNRFFIWMISNNYY